MNFPTCDSLLERLSQRVRERSKIFVINVNSRENYSQIYNHFPETQKIHLSKYAENDECPYLERCYRYITNQVSGNNQLVIGFSPHFSILSEEDRTHIFSKILNLNLNSKSVHAVIFLFYGYDDFFRKKISEDLRLNEWIFLLNDRSELPYPEMIFVPPDTNIECVGVILPGYAHYLSILEKDPQKSLVVCTQFGRSLCPKLPYPITSISSAYDLLVKMKDLPKNIPQESLSESEWAELFSASQSESIYQYLSKEYPSRDLQSVFLGFSQDANKKKRWLYLKYLEDLQQTTSYLGHVLHLSTSFDDFQRRFFEEILEISCSDKKYFAWYHERREGIRQIFPDKSESIFTYIQKAKALGDEMIYYLTDLSKEEKHSILRWISQHPDSPLECLDEIYPDLSSYLSPYQFSGHEDFTEYFQEYKIQKVRNILKPEFLETVQEFSAIEKHPYLSLDSRPAILERIGYDPTNAYWFIDCLGSEYLGFITKFFSNRDVSVRVQIVSATLPTETEYNTEFRQDYGKSLKPWRKLDEIKHDGDETPSTENESVPTYIVEELESLKKCLEKISADLVTHKKVVIISDHGSSRLCVLNYKGGQTSSIRVNADNVKVRYCQNPSDDLSSVSGLVRQGEYQVWADYNRFSVQGGPRWEVHGGATLEEVVIPIIELTKRDRTYQIVCLRNTLKVKPMAKVCLEFTVSPICDREITAFIRDINKDKEFVCNKENKEQWACELPENIKAGSYTATVRYQGQDIGEVMFSIEKGMKKNNLLGGKR